MAAPLPVVAIEITVGARTSIPKRKLTRSLPLLTSTEAEVGNLAFYPHLAAMKQGHLPPLPEQYQKKPGGTEG